MTYTLNLLDLLTTLIALRLGADELNPLLQDPLTMTAYKVVVVGLLIRWLQSRPEILAKHGLRVCAFYFAAAILNNLFIITKLIGGQT